MFLSNSTISQNKAQTFKRIQRKASSKQQNSQCLISKQKSVGMQKNNTTNKQENMIHKETNQLFELNSEMTKVLGLVSKDIKTCYIQNIAERN